jgi:hypothetical protein
MRAVSEFRLTKKKANEEERKRRRTCSISLLRDSQTAFFSGVEVTSACRAKHRNKDGRGGGDIASRSWMYETNSACVRSPDKQSIIFLYILLAWNDERMVGESDLTLLERERISERL